MGNTRLFSFGSACSGLWLGLLFVLIVGAAEGVWAQTTAASPYCQPTITDVVPNKGITAVTFGSIINPTLVIQDFTFFNNQPLPQLQITVSQALNVTQTIGLTTGVWADWNRNNSFEGNERVAEQVSVSSTVPLVFQVVPPPTTLSGIVRLRIRAIEGVAGIDPCVTGGIGETEDYQFLVIPTLTITTSVLGDSVIGSNYSQQISANYGTPPLSWSLSSGTLPNGLVFSSLGVIAGVPRKDTNLAGPYQLAFTVADSATPQAVRTVVLSLAVLPYTGPPVNVVAASLPNATEQGFYVYSVSATGGANPNSSPNNVTFTVTGGAFPPGVSMNAFGSITGTVPKGNAGVYTFDVAATDPAGFADTQAFTLTVLPAPTGGGGLGGGGSGTASLSGGGGCAVDVASGGWAAIALALLAALAGLATYRRRRA